VKLPTIERKSPVVRISGPGDFSLSARFPYALAIFCRGCAKTATIWWFNAASRLAASL
jgi:hypothetical protein